MNTFSSAPASLPLYQFNDVQRAVEFNRHDAPTPWINYLSNGNLHAFISQAGGGLLWWKSPLNFRITRYRAYNLPIDTPGFYIYIREKDGTIWSPSFRPCETPLNEWKSQHQPGRTTFIARKGNLSARLEFFIAPDHDTLVWDLTVTNHSGQTVDVDVFAYAELSLLGWKIEVDISCYIKHQLKAWFDPELNSTLYLYHHDGHPRRDDVPLVYLASTRPVVSAECDRDQFVGNYRDERNPIAVEKGTCDNHSITCGEPCAAIQNQLSIAPSENLRTSFFLGVTPHALKDFKKAIADTAATLAQLRKQSTVDEQSKKLNAWWDNHLNILQCQLPDADAQRQINTWNPVQSVHTGRYSRSIGFYSMGVRGLGFRDTCQDMLAIAYRKPAWASDMLLYQCSQQYEDGHAVHTCYPEDRQPPSTSIHSDDHLWMPLMAYAIVSETGDLSVLSKTAHYLAEDSISEGKSATVWEHLVAAIEFTQSHLGAHGIPLTLKSDWNDVIGRFARKGKGESIFAAQQYIYALRLMVEMAEALNDLSNKKRFEQLIDDQVKALAACAWDGQWWRRGFDDDGTPIGAHDSSFGKIWVNPQNWAVLSNSGTSDQLRTGMDAVSKHLDTDMGVLILTPSFKTWPEISDPFSGYSPGSGENGAIFCHANTWTIIAETLLGNGDRAWKYYRQLIPHVALQKVGADRYCGEPYAYASNIIGPDSTRYGWANVTQMTGTSAWMDVAATQYILGLRPQITGLRIDPCIPSQWDGFEVQRTWRGCKLDIKVTNPKHVSKGVASIEVEGKCIDIRNAPILSPNIVQGKQTIKILVTMG